MEQQTTVLVVDDEQDIVELMRDFVEATSPKSQHACRSVCRKCVAGVKISACRTRSDK